MGGMTATLQDDSNLDEVTRGPPITGAKRFQRAGSDHLVGAAHKVVFLGKREGNGGAPIGEPPH